MILPLFFLYCMHLCWTWREVTGYRFNCLETERGQCKCDTEEEVIDCHGKSLRSFPEISHRLRGFSILSLFDNDLQGPLPEEAALRRLLPNLQLIDLENNPHLNCTEISQKYEVVKILSPCLNGDRSLQKTVLELPVPEENSNSDNADISGEQQEKLCRDFLCELERGMSRKGSSINRVIKITSFFNQKPIDSWVT